MASDKWLSPADEYIHSMPGDVKGPGLRELAQKWCPEGIRLDTFFRRLCDQSSRERWVEQRQRFLSEVSAKIEQKTADTLAGVAARQAREYLHLQGMAIKALNQLRAKLDDPNFIKSLEPHQFMQALKIAGDLMDKAIQGERKVLRLDKQETDEEKDDEGATGASLEELQSIYAEHHQDDTDRSRAA